MAFNLRAQDFPHTAAGYPEQEVTLGTPPSIVGLTRLPTSLSPAMIHYMDSRILIVDDNPRFRALAAELLAARGFELVEEVAGGEQALAAVAVECPGGVLLDINLPGLNGFEIAALLAAVCPQPGSCWPLPIPLYSGRDPEDLPCCGVRIQAAAGRHRPQALFAG